MRIKAVAIQELTYFSLELIWEYKCGKLLEIFWCTWQEVGFFCDKGIGCSCDFCIEQLLNSLKTNSSMEDVSWIHSEEEQLENLKPCYGNDGSRLSIFTEPWLLMYNPRTTHSTMKRMLYVLLHQVPHSQRSMKLLLVHRFSAITFLCLLHS